MPTDQIWAPGQLGYRDDAGYPGYDLERAKQLVAQYRTETGKDLTFSMTSADDIDSRRVQQLLADQWRAAGIQVDLKVVTQADLVVVGALGYLPGRRLAQLRTAGPRRGVRLAPLAQHRSRRSSR